jgi:3-deoxy-D-manno-octulosonate 8-phosphate phosphatase KdsC-like HAD superfamily phosphatase
VFEELVERTGLNPAEVIFVGDDLLDLPVLHAVGVPMTVPGARDEVIRDCCYVSETLPGWGAVREIVELVLEAKGLFERIVASDGRPFSGTGESQGGL